MLCGSPLTATGGATGLPGAQPVDAVLMAHAASLAATTHVSLAQAVADIKIQGEAGAPRVVSALRAALGSSFAGVWFDPALGRFEVGAAPGTDGGIARVALAALGIAPAQFDLVPVKRTWGALEDANAGWTAREMPLIRRRVASVGIDPARNAVQITVDGGIPTDQLAALRRAVASDAHLHPGHAEVIVATRPAGGLDQPLRSCTFPYCDLPLRGGVYLKNPSHRCTTGFTVTSNVDQSQDVLTAGHCTAGSVGQWVYTYDAAGAQHYFGQVINSIFGAQGDASLISITDRPGFDPNPFFTLPGGSASEVAAWPDSTDYPIYAAEDPYVGEFACHYGVGSEVQCGPVTEPIDATADGGIGHLTHDLSCALGGDSGGPVVAYNMALGTMVGASPCSPDNTQPESWFMTARPAEQLLDVTIGGIRQLAWTSQDSGTGRSLAAVAFSDATNGWAVGDGGTILHTTDGGATWSSEDSFSADSSLRAVATTDAGNAWAVGDDGAGSPIILHSSDSGVTWTPQQLGITGNLLAGVAFPSATDGWAVGGAGLILHTSDAGASWEQQTDGDPGLYDLGGVTFTDAATGWAVGKNGTVIHTTDGGVTWTVQTQGDPTNATLLSIAFPNATDGWAVGENGVIVHTADGGATWTPQNSGAPGVTLQHVAFPTPMHGWAVGSNGTILATTDGGATWTTQQSGDTTQSFGGVSFPDAVHGWAVGLGGTILAYS
jgi:photosystem II stability/assembly factor-like uncharacterized protein